VDDPKVGDFVIFEVPIRDKSGLSILPYVGQGLVFASQGLTGRDRLRGAVRTVLPDTKMAVVVRMDDEYKAELAEFRYITVVPIHELTARERDFMFRFNRDKLLVNREPSRPQMY
jgi:hypothetical protein